jgi:hypothetical protein
VYNWSWLCPVYLGGYDWIVVSQSRDAVCLEELAELYKELRELKTALDDISGIKYARAIEILCDAKPSI